MPPDPILGLLCFVGLAVYSVIGGAVGTFAVNTLGEIGYRGRENYMKALAGTNDRAHDDQVGVWIGFGFAAILWPAVVAVTIVSCIFAGPVWLAHKVGRYTAAAQLKQAK